MRAVFLGPLVALGAAHSALFLASCAGHSMEAARAGGSSHRGEGSVAAPRGDALERGLAALDASRYKDAETELRSVLGANVRARIGLARVLLATGRARLAEETSSDVVGATPPQALELTVVRALAMRREGKLDLAISVLESASGDPEAREARVLLGQTLIDRGRRSEAEPVLMTLIEEYNKGDLKDGKILSLVGRAASLLGSPSDANDAFEEAEHAGASDADTLLFRARVFLDAYDPGHAEEVVSEVLAKAPNHPLALALMAETKLASNLDFDAAEKLAKQALTVDPTLGPAESVLAGVALRDMNLDVADSHVNAGLGSNPKDLDLLSMRAAVRFLADDAPGFARAKAAVLAENPRYSRLYQVVGEYAEWEHRYEDIVALMHEALFADQGDAKVRAELGFNLIRAGEEASGVAALARAFQDDPFNVRVLNTLNLYEKEIPKGYETVQRGRFTVRYHKDETAILDRYVPKLLDHAWDVLVKKYGFSPKTPVGVELYPTREHFAIRTSGLPQTFIQGVCFGHTLAAMSPHAEHFNIGMTLWHELSHVFHIQLSKNHVPRWFTEGLAEHETLVARPEWRREYDAELYVALDQGRIPSLTDLNRTFTHAEDMDDMATAYYASTQVVGYIVDRWGMKKVTDMLVAWGEGKRTEEVIRSVLGVSSDEVDQGFRAMLRDRLSRFRTQFSPPARSGDVATAEARVKAAPNDAEKRALLALARLSIGDEARAKADIARALAMDPKQGVALWLSVQLEKTSENRAGTKKALETLIAAGHDGYAVRMMLAEAVTKPEDRRAALEAAHAFDPLKPDPLHGLVELARASKDEDAELAALRSLSVVEENDGDAYRRLLKMLLARNAIDEAKTVGEAAVFVDVESVETHRLYGEVLARAHDAAGAEAEFESAVHGFGTPVELARAHGELAQIRAARGDKKGAEAEQRAAQAAAREANTGPI